MKYYLYEIYLVNHVLIVINYYFLVNHSIFSRWGRCCRTNIDCLGDHDIHLKTKTVKQVNHSDKKRKKREFPYFINIHFIISISCSITDTVLGKMPIIKLIQYRANQWPVSEMSTKVFPWNTS